MQEEARIQTERHASPWRGNLCSADPVLLRVYAESFAAQGKLKCLGHDVDLASWETFLKFVDWLPRPDNFQLAGSGGVACSLVGPGGRSSSLPHPLSRSSTQADPLPATCLD